MTIGHHCPGCLWRTRHVHGEACHRSPGDDIDLSGLVELTSDDLDDEWQWIIIFNDGADDDHYTMMSFRMGSVRTWAREALGWIWRLPRLPMISPRLVYRTALSLSKFSSSSPSPLSSSSSSSSSGWIKNRWRFKKLLKQANDFLS